MPGQAPPWKRAAEALRARFGEPPVAAVVLGSGAGGVLDAVGDGDDASYGDVGLHQTGVVGHAGQVRVGRMGARRVAVLAGRVHLYEGVEMEQALRTVRALAGWGVQRVVLTSAVGSLHRDLGPGSLVRITDHMNFTGRSALLGPNDDALGPRFPDMARAYDPDDGMLARRVAADRGITLREGVYVGVMGPNYETAAEIRAFAQLGGTVVGMSLVHEVTAACHAGLRTTAICVVSNLACGLATETLDHSEVTEVVGKATAELAVLVEGLVGQW